MDKASNRVVYTSPHLERIMMDLRKCIETNGWQGVFFFLTSIPRTIALLAVMTCRVSGKYNLHANRTGNYQHSVFSQHPSPLCLSIASPRLCSLSRFVDAFVDEASSFLSLSVNLNIHNSAFFFLSPLHFR